MSSESSLQLPRSMVDRILDHARNSTNTEICGLIGHRKGRAASWYPVDNIAQDPRRRFQMDPGQQIAAMKSMRQQGEELFAIVHSHPDSPAVPSDIDRDEIGYPDAYYMIVSLQNRQAPELRCFRQRKNDMQEIHLEYDRNA